MPGICCAGEAANWGITSGPAAVIRNATTIRILPSVFIETSIAYKLGLILLYGGELPTSSNLLQAARVVLSLLRQKLPENVWRNSKRAGFPDRWRQRAHRSRFFQAWSSATRRRRANRHAGNA